MKQLERHFFFEEGPTLLSRTCALVTIEIPFRTMSNLEDESVPRKHENAVVEMFSLKGARLTSKKTFPQ